MKVAFLDRDGTIIEDYEDQEWKNIKEPIFKDDAIETMKKIEQKGYKIIIITNQYLINEGIITLTEYYDFTDKVLKELEENQVKVLDVFFCPHSRKEECYCMKPKDGLIKKALEKYPEIELEESFIVGDSLCDIELGKNLDIKSFGIKLKTDYKNTIEISSIKDILQYI